ncbi:MAG: cupin domain-containing protein [Candidatus Buchananbacteria bacterium]|jgi:quercetin dioxygenase-like cupin family protein
MLSINSSEVYKLAELVNYQSGAIVSKEIVAKPTGTMTVFAFDAGQGLSEHKAPFDAVVYVIDGQAEVFIAGEKQSVAQGEMIILPVDVVHSLKAEQRFKMALIMIRS